MATRIKVGTVFIQDRPRILRTLALESNPVRKVGRCFNLGRTLAWVRGFGGTGWNASLWSAEVRASAPGRISVRSVHRALMQIFAKVRNADFNCLEVTGLIENRFFGRALYNCLRSFPPHPTGFQDGFCSEGTKLRTTVGQFELRKP